MEDSSDGNDDLIDVDAQKIDLKEAAEKLKSGAKKVVKKVVDTVKTVADTINPEKQTFKLPGSIHASWSDAGCKSPVSKPCNEVCRVNVATTGATVNRLNKLLDITLNLQAAVQLAHDQAVKRSLPSCSVVLPKGQYTLSATVQVLSRVHIMGNSASIQLPPRDPLAPFFAAFRFEGQGPSAADTHLTFTKPSNAAIGPGKSITLPSNVAQAAAKLLSSNERVVLHAVLTGVPDMKIFKATQHTFLYEKYDDVVGNGDGAWGKNPLGYYVEILSVQNNVARLRSALPYHFDNSAACTLTLIPASKFVTNAALTDIFLSRPPLSSVDVQIVQARSCKNEKGSQCELVHEAFKTMSPGSADMLQLRYALDVNIARNSFTGIVRSAALFDHTLHSCFSDNTVTDALLFADTGAGQGDGVILNQYSSYNSVVTNTFSKLRHAMLLQFGANGNVVANNKNDKVRCQICRPSPVSTAVAADITSVLSSTWVLNPVEKAWGKVMLHSLQLDASRSAVVTACVNTQYENNDSKEFMLFGNKVDWCADVSFHGLYSNNNLVEGNDVDSIKIADYYGPSPSNVVFGNRINARSLGIVVDRASTDTAIIDNLFTDGGISFFDDASSSMCVNNKQCAASWSCLLKKAPEFHDIDFFKTSCGLYGSSTVQSALSSLATTKLGKKVDLQGKVKFFNDGCAYWDRVLGGRDDKTACEAQNDKKFTDRPVSLFAGTTLKACSELSPKCFDGMRRPAGKLTCTAQSGSDLELGDDDEFDVAEGDFEDEHVASD